MDINELKLRADAGSIVAQTLLGIGYIYGSDGEVNYQEALRLLTLAADKGVPRAVMNLGHMYAHGLGVPSDIDKAVRLYERVANTEFDAAIALARIYSRGEGAFTDHELALKWYLKAAEFDVIDCEELTEAKEYALRWG